MLLTMKSKTKKSPTAHSNNTKSCIKKKSQFQWQYLENGNKNTRWNSVRMVPRDKFIAFNMFINFEVH